MFFMRIIRLVFKKEIGQRINVIKETGAPFSSQSGSKHSTCRGGASS